MKSSGSDDEVGAFGGSAGARLAQLLGIAGEVADHGVELRQCYLEAVCDCVRHEPTLGLAPRYAQRCRWDSYGREIDGVASSRNSPGDGRHPAVGDACHAHDPQGPDPAVPDHGHRLCHRRGGVRARRLAARPTALHPADSRLPGARHLWPVRLPRALFRGAEAGATRRTNAPSSFPPSAKIAGTVASGSA